MDAIGSAKAIHKKVVEWRRELHRIPETDFDLVKTSQFVKDRLDEFGVEHRVMGRTGVVGLVREIKDSPTIALRADMDALPINEETGLPFASKNGKMHACGHDAHT
ncbi:MAG: M20/M25/M40 family metallo-hydrolase, partial [Thermovirgaceae bacterium]